MIFLGVLDNGINVPDYIAAFASLCSALIAWLALRIAKQSQNLTEKQLWQSLRSDRLQVFQALIKFNGFIQRKICTYKYDQSNPGKFLVTEDELLLLDEVRDQVFQYGSSLGFPLGKEIQEWYTYVFSELHGQMRETEHGGGKSTLPEDKQDEYLAIRREYAKEVHGHLNKIQNLLYFEEQTKSSWLKQKIQEFKNLVKRK